MVRQSRVKWLTVTLVLIIHCHLLWQVCMAIVSLRDYCDAFPDTLKPVICIIKENKIVKAPVGSSTTSRSTTIGWGLGWTESWGPPFPQPPFEGWHESSEEVSEESTGCDCDLTCLPRFGANENDTNTLLCKQCGNHCDVKTSVDTRCSCAAVGTGLSRRRKSVDFFDDDYILTDQRIQQLRQGMGTTCTCTVTCAHAQRDRSWDDDDTPFCIFNITGIPNSSKRRPVTCECCKSKAAAHNKIPDFVCICQQT